MTLAATTKKLRISLFKYLYDRVVGAYRPPSLAEVIAQRAQCHSLGVNARNVPASCCGL